MLKEALEDALTGAKYVLPATALWGFSIWAFGHWAVLAPLVGFILFAACVLVGLFVNSFESLRR